MALSNHLLKEGVLQSHIDQFVTDFGLSTLFELKYCIIPNDDIEKWIKDEVSSLPPWNHILQDPVQFPLLVQGLKSARKIAASVNRDLTDVEFINSQIDAKASSSSKNPKRIQPQNCLLDKTIQNSIDKIKAEAGKRKSLDEAFVLADKKAKWRMILNDPDLVEQGTLQVLLDTLALSTRLSYSSEAKLYENFCSSQKLPPWPITKNTMTKFAGALKLAEYSAGSNYLTAISKVNHLMGHELGASLEKTKKELQISLVKTKMTKVFVTESI